MGQVLQVNFEYEVPPSLQPLGAGNGYQHLYLEGTGEPSSAKVIGPHCGYSPVTRIAGNSNSSIAELKIVHDDEDYTAVSVEDLEGGAGLFILSNSDAAASAEHKLSIGNRDFTWSGAYHYTEL